MLDLLIKSSVRRKIIGFFTINEGEKFYPQQVSHEIQESPYMVGLELRALSQGGLLKVVQEGGRNYYQWNPGYPFATELKSIVEKLRDQGNEEIKNLPDLKRKKQIERNLAKILEDLKKYYDPEKVILFGSAASGKTGSYSDIDMVIVKKTSLPYFERVEQLVDLLHYDIGVDFLIYTPEEFNQASNERLFFQEEILKKGKILYEKAA